VEGPELAWNIDKEMGGNQGMGIWGMGTDGGEGGTCEGSGADGDGGTRGGSVRNGGECGGEGGGCRGGRGAISLTVPPSVAL
jgi:hypothetical protein